jgi:hypothetical protein
MRICRVVATGIILEAQSHATEGILLQNAVNYGYQLADIEELEVTEDEYAALIAPAPETLLQKKTRLRAAALAVRNADIARLGSQYCAAVCADGSTESTKIASIRADTETSRLTYLAALAAITALTA